MISKSRPQKEYLGDGVYVQDDGGFQILLSTNRGRSQDDEIYLDGHSIDELFRFIEKVRGVTITAKRDATPGASAEGSTK